MKYNFKSFAIIFAALFSISIFGMLGFHFIEGWNWFDSLYMAIITLTTVGFSEVHPMSTAGRAFVMVYLAVSLGASLYSLALLGEILLHAQFFQWFGRRRKMKEESLKDHYVVFGYGRMGRILSDHLREKGHPVLVIEKNPDHIAEAEQKGLCAIHADPTEQDIFPRLNLGRAKGVATVLGGDADNLFVVLAIRMDHKALPIIARATSLKAQHMIEKAGANEVVCPYTAGALAIAKGLSPSHNMR